MEKSSSMQTAPSALPASEKAQAEQANARVLGDSLRLGLVGGLVAIFIGLTGMVQAFSTRDIISGIVSMSQIALLFAFFGTAYAATGKHHTASVPFKVLAGVIAGFISSLLVVLLVAVGQVVGLGYVFISATQPMYDLLTLKQGLQTGSAMLLGLGAGTGLFAALIYLLPSMARRAVTTGLMMVVTLGLLQELVRVTLSEWDVILPLLKFLYEQNGLSVPGAIAIFVVVAGLAYVWNKQRDTIQNKLAVLPAPTRRTLRWSSIGIFFLFLLLVPILFGLYISDVLDNVGLYLMMGLGLNIVVGFAGLLDLGYVAFFAIGAYTVGILTSPEHATGVIGNWWVALPFAVAAAVLAGVMLGIPVLKMRGDYLAIVTLGFGEIIRYFAISDFLKPWEGGAQGIQGIPLPNIGPIVFAQMPLDLPFFGLIQFTPSQEFYYLFLAGCLLVMFITVRVKNSRVGRAWMAIREDEDVAQAMGINLVSTKLMAFGLGAAFGGLSGAIFASKLQSVYPTSFSFLVSVYVLSIIIIGGMGSIPGVVLGALALVGLPELLREVGDFRYMFFGAALVVMMLVRPEGLLPEARRRLELEEFKQEEGGAEAGGQVVPA